MGEGSGMKDPQSGMQESLDRILFRGHTARYSWLQFNWKDVSRTQNQRSRYYGLDTFNHALAGVASA